MPLLPLEPFVHPPDLLSAEVPPCGAWWAIRTHSRAEKTIARKLFQAGVPFFLPLSEKAERRGGRVRTSYHPLFPSYLFLHGDEGSRVQALKTNQVAQLLPVVDPLRLWTDLARVYRIMEAGPAAWAEEALPAGTPVRLVAGPLEGMEGVILRRGRRLHFVVEVRFLQRGVAVEVEAGMVQRLAPPRQREGKQTPDAEQV